MRTLKTLFRITAILSFFCLLSNMRMTYMYHHAYERMGDGYNFWVDTLRWWSFWISVCVSCFFCWRIIIALIIFVSPIIIKWGFLGLNGIQSIFWPPISIIFYLKSPYGIANVDAIFKLIFILTSFILLFFIGREWLGNTRFKKNHMQKKSKF